MPIHSSSGPVVISGGSEFTTPFWVHHSNLRLRIGPIPNTYSGAYSDAYQKGQSTVENVFYLKLITFSTAIVDIGATASNGVPQPIEVATEIRWTFNKGPLNYFRVESDCIPRTCPPIGDDNTTCLQGSRISAIITARTLSEVCAKLSAQDFVFPVNNIVRYDPPFLESERTEDDDTSCRVLVDVTDDFNEVAGCFPFSLDGDIDLGGVEELSMGVEVDFFISVHGSTGGLVLSGDSDIDATYQPSSLFEYCSTADVVFGGESGATSPNYVYSSTVPITITVAENNNPPQFVSSSAASLVIGGHNDAVIVGTITGATDATEAVMEADITAVSAVIAAPVLVSSGGITVATLCCPNSNTPTLMAMQHPLGDTATLAQFARRNGLTIPNPLSLTYSVQTSSWQGNLVLTGTGINTTNQQTWHVLFEFGCVPNSFGPTDLATAPTVWRFNLNATVKDNVTGEVFRTRLLLFFDQDVVCVTSFPVAFQFSFNVQTLATTPSVTSAPVFEDGAGLFKSPFWFTSPEVLMKFTTAQLPPVPFTIYPELRTPIREVRGAAPITNNAVGISLTPV